VPSPVNNDTAFTVTRNLLAKQNGRRLAFSFAVARSSLPSPLKSPLQWKMGHYQSHREGALERPAAIAKQDRYRIATAIYNRQIEFAVSIEVSDSYR